ncbi:hypothetical protein SLS62_001868 [Diatrype stigma]|uniref:Berberine/berberine-like domain-containing protein n=1 Tax=Diatrype stigma TaxID=117547 RepID=A0AAN9YVK9_9PEZI
MLAYAPELHRDEVDELLQPTLKKMDELGLEYQYSSSEYPTFLSAYTSLTSSWNVSDYNIGGRLIPRSLVSNNLNGLVEAIRYITTQTLMSGVTFNVKNAVSSAADVAVNPYFRETLFSATVGTPINYNSSAANQVAQDKLTYDLLPALEKLTPNGGVYLNEADFQQPDFKSTFYGNHYDRLLSVKRRYDPEDVFYAKTAVGSDFWKQDADGRLCKVSRSWIRGD